jgi:hypothetical protein
MEKDSLFAFVADHPKMVTCHALFNFTLANMVSLLTANANLPTALPAHRPS